VITKSNLSAIKYLTILLWVIALVLLIGALLRVGLPTNQSTAIRAEEKEELDSSGWKAVQTKKGETKKGNMGDNLMAVYGGAETGLVGIAEIDHLYEEEGKEGERCVVAILTAPVSVIPQPNWNPKIVPGAGSEDELYGKPTGWLPGISKQHLLASALVQLPSLPPPLPDLIPVPELPPSLPPPPAPPVEELEKPAWLLEDLGLGNILKKFNSFKDFIKALGHLNVSVAVQVPSSDPSLFRAIKNNKICAPRAYPMGLGSFKNGAEVAGHLGTLKTNPNIAVVLLRMCGNNIPPGITSSLSLWGEDPKMGSAIIYTLATDYLKGGKLSPPVLIEREIEITSDGKIMPKITEKDRVDFERLEELEEKHDNAGITLFDPKSVRFGYPLVGETEVSEFFRLRRKFGQKYGSLLGAPIFQDGQKVGVYMGGGRFAPISDINKGLLQLLASPK